MNNEPNCGGHIEGQPDFVSGNIFIRPVQLGKGLTCGGHTHNFDHTSFVLKGSVRVKTSCDACSKYVPREQVFTAPAYFLVHAEVKHEITALEDAVVWCVYSHRNAQGEVVQHFDGWGEFSMDSAGSHDVYQ